MLSSEFLQSVLTDQAVGSKENKAAGNMVLSCTFLKMQVMLSRKSFSPLVLCTSLALELWKRQLKLFQESAWSLVIKSGVSPLPLGWVSGSARGQKETLLSFGKWFTWLWYLPPGVLAALSEGLCGLCAKIPSAECSVMSERVPIGWKGVDKQEQICIQRCALWAPRAAARLRTRKFGHSLSWAGSGAGGSLQYWAQKEPSLLAAS